MSQDYQHESLSSVVPEGSRLAKLHQELSRRESQLEIQAKNFVEELSANHANFRAFSEEARVTIGSLKVTRKAD